MTFDPNDPGEPRPEDEPEKPDAGAMPKRLSSLLLERLEKLLDQIPEGLSRKEYKEQEGPKYVNDESLRERYWSETVYNLMGNAYDQVGKKTPDDDPQFKLPHLLDRSVLTVIDHLTGGKRKMAVQHATLAQALEQSSIMQTNAHDASTSAVIFNKEVMRLIAIMDGDSRATIVAAQKRDADLKKKDGD